MRFTAQLSRRHRDFPRTLYIYSCTQPRPSSDRPPMVLLLELMPLPSHIINDPESTLTWGFTPGAGRSMASDKRLMTCIHYSISPSGSTALKICFRCSFIPFDFWTMYTYSRKQAHCKHSSQFRMPSSWGRATLPVEFRVKWREELACWSEDRSAHFLYPFSSPTYERLCG